MSFDALTITGMLASLLCGGFLILLADRNELDRAAPPRGKALRK